MLLVVETCGMATLLFYWIPMYRRLVAGPGGDRPGAGILGPILLGNVAVLACYWIRRSLPAPPPPRRNALTGHILLFLSRLTFVFAGSTLTLFLVRAGDTTASPFGLSVAVVTLFSVFCYMLELDRLSRRRFDD
jgi:hypothetical protein